MLLKGQVKWRLGIDFGILEVSGDLNTKSSSWVVGVKAWMDLVSKGIKKEEIETESVGNSFEELFYKRRRDWREWVEYKGACVKGKSCQVGEITAYLYADRNDVEKGKIGNVERGVNY